MAREVMPITYVSLLGLEAAGQLRSIWVSYTRLEVIPSCSWYVRCTLWALKSSKDVEAFS